MSDAAELKKLVKQLQSTSTDEVCVISYGISVALLSISDPPVFVQETVSILQTLKKDYQVNEAILRVGISRRFSVSVGANFRP
jgi:hypothetical protein